MQRSLLLFLPLLVFVFSCDKKKDDPKPASNSNGIEGTWEYAKYTRIAYDSTGKHLKEWSIQHNTGGIFLKFSSQGTVEEGETHTGKADATGTYFLKNNQLTFNVTRAYHIHSGTYQVDTLSAKRLAIVDTLYTPTWSPGGFDFPPGGYEVHIVKAFR